MTEPDCLFCRIIAGQVPARRVHEDDLVVAIEDINPVAPVHTLLMPRRHVTSAADLGEDDGPMLGRLFAVAAHAGGRCRPPRARLSSRLQRGGRRWSVRAPPPRPPHRRTALRLATRLSRCLLAPGTGRRRAVGAATLLAFVAALNACASAERPSVQADVVPLPTPLQSWAPSTASVIAELGASVSGVGHRLDAPMAAYRPSEPASLLQAPRVVLRADLADPGDGFVVVYDAPDGEQASSWGRELAAYLGSGFGQANFTPDTQFSVAVRDDVVIFTSWSPGRSSDAASAESVFDAVAAVGDPIEVVK